jgi:hypothetical protein
MQTLTTNDKLEGNGQQFPLQMLWCDYKCTTLLARPLKWNVKEMFYNITQPYHHHHQNTLEMLCDCWGEREFNTIAFLYNLTSRPGFATVFKCM